MNKYTEPRGSVTLYVSLRVIFAYPPSVSGRKENLLRGYVLEDCIMTLPETSLARVGRASASRRRRRRSVMGHTTMRRSVGVGRVKATSAFQDKAHELEEASLEHVRKSVEAFRGHLEEFAVKHKHNIANDPEFRAAFATMCA
jgi:hypothetical protein